MNDIRKSQRGGNTVYLNIGAWLDKETGHIHLTLPHSDWFHTTVNAEDGSVRCHKNLYGKLARALREGGAPSPDTKEAE